MGAVAAHEKPGELSPQARVVEAWGVTENAIGNFLRGKRTKKEEKELAATLTAYTDTLPLFIQEYIGDDHVPDIAGEAYLLVAQLQEGLFALHAIANNTDRSIFQPTNWVASEGHATESILQAMNQSEEGTKSFEELVVANIYTHLCTSLGNNVNNLLANNFATEPRVTPETAA